MGNKVNQIAAEIVYNDTVKLTVLMIFYKQAKTILESLDQYGDKTIQLEKFLKPLKEIYHLVGDDVVAYFRNKLGVVAKKEMVEKDRGREAVYIFEPANTHVPLMLIDFIANKDFFEMRNALVTITAQLSDFTALLEGWPKKDTIMSSLFKEAGDKLINAAQITMQFALLGDQLAKADDATEEIKTVGKHFSMLGNLFSTNANTSADGEDVKAIKIPEAMRSALEEKQTDFSRRFEKARESLCEDERRAFERLKKISWQKYKINARFAVLEKSSEYSAAEFQIVRTRKEKIEAEIDAQYESLAAKIFVIAELLNSAEYEKAEKKFQAATTPQEIMEKLSVKTIECGKIVKAFFDLMVANKDKLREAQGKKSVNVKPDSATQILKSIEARIESHKTDLDLLLVEWHKKYSKEIPSTLPRINSRVETNAGNSMTFGSVRPRRSYSVMRTTIAITESPIPSSEKISEVLSAEVKEKASAVVSSSSSSMAIIMQKMPSLPLSNAKQGQDIQAGSAPVQNGLAGFSAGVRKYASANRPADASANTVQAVPNSPRANPDRSKIAAELEKKLANGDHGKTQPPPPNCNKK